MSFKLKNIFTSWPHAANIKVFGRTYSYIPKSLVTLPQILCYRIHGFWAALIGVDEGSTTLNFQSLLEFWFDSKIPKLILFTKYGYLYRLYTKNC